MKTLPGGWKKYKIKDIGTVVTGNTPPKNEPQNYDGDLPWIKPPDLDNGMFVSTSVDTISEFGRKKIRSLPKGSVLVSCIGNIGKVAIAERELCTNQQINSIIPNREIVDSVFLYYVIKKIRPKLEEAASSFVVSLLNKTDFSNIELSFPPLPTQMKIAAVLEKAEETKKLRAQADELTDRLLQSVFMEMFGDPVKNPMGWEMIMLGNVVEQSMNGFGRRSQENLEKKPIVLRIKDVQNGYIDISSPRRIAMSSEEYQQYQLKKNDFLYVRVNGSLELVGKSAIIPDIKEEVTFSDHIVRVRFYQTKICSMYIHFLAQTSYFRSNLLKQVVTTAGQNSLGFNRLAKIIIPLPPLPLQQEFSRIVEKVEAMRQSQNQSKQQIEDLFSALMQKAFRGEI